MVMIFYYFRHFVVNEIVLACTTITISPWTVVQPQTKEGFKQLPLLCVHVSRSDVLKFKSSCIYAQHMLISCVQLDCSYNSRMYLKICCLPWALPSIVLCNFITMLKPSNHTEVAIVAACISVHLSHLPSSY